MSEEDRPLIKLVVVGDGAVGKTCLLVSYIEKVFPEKYIPTIFNNTRKEVTFGSGGVNKVNLDLWDTAGQEWYDQIRFRIYRDTNVFLFCYSCVDSDSFLNIKSKWMPEINYHMKDSKPTKVIVGLKSDLLEDKKTLEQLSEAGKGIVERSTVEQYAEANGMAFMEVSALKKKNVGEVFELAIEEFLGGVNDRVIKSNRRCDIL